MFKQILFLAISTLCLSVLTTPTRAQENGYAYLFAAPGATAPGGTGILHTGTGAELVYENGAGAAFEIGYLWPFAEPKSGLGLFSLNGSYHFQKDGNQKTVPFITGGYTGFFRGFYANGVNFGGGVTHWFKPRVGVRIEFRDSVALDEGETSHFVGAGVGLTFR